MPRDKTYATFCEMQSEIIITSFWVWTRTTLNKYFFINSIDLRERWTTKQVRCPFRSPFEPFIFSRQPLLKVFPFNKGGRVAFDLFCLQPNLLIQMLLEPFLSWA